MAMRICLHTRSNFPISKWRSIWQDREKISPFYISAFTPQKLHPPITVVVRNGHHVHLLQRQDSNYKNKGHHMTKYCQSDGSCCSVFSDELELSHLFLKEVKLALPVPTSVCVKRGFLLKLLCEFVFPCFCCKFALWPVLISIFASEHFILLCHLFTTHPMCKGLFKSAQIPLIGAIKVLFLTTNMFIPLYRVIFLTV